MDWSKLMNGKVFITDLGENQTAQINDKQATVGRYAVWSPLTNSDKHQIIEVSESLEPMMSKYKVPEERVCRITNS